MIKPDFHRGLFEAVLSANVENDDWGEMIDDFDEEAGEYESGEDEEDYQELGQIYCPQPNCFSFAFDNIGGNFFECHNCGMIYNLDEDDLPYIPNEEIANADNN